MRRHHRSAVPAGDPAIDEAYERLFSGPPETRPAYYARKAAREARAEEKKARVNREAVITARAGRVGKLWLYVAQISDGGPVKIGRARDVSRRIASLEAGLPYRLVEIARVPDGGGIERKIHRALAEFNLKGEWYSAEALDAALKLIEEFAQRPAQRRAA